MAVIVYSIDSPSVLLVGDRIIDLGKLRVFTIASPDGEVIAAACAENANCFYLFSVVL